MLLQNINKLSVRKNFTLVCHMAFIWRVLKTYFKKHLTLKENFVDFEGSIRIIYYCNTVITEMLFETSVKIQRSKSAQISNTNLEGNIVTLISSQ